MSVGHVETHPYQSQLAMWRVVAQNCAKSYVPNIIPKKKKKKKGKVIQAREMPVDNRVFFVQLTPSRKIHILASQYINSITCLSRYPCPSASATTDQFLPVAHMEFLVHLVCPLLGLDVFQTFDPWCAFHIVYSLKSFHKSACGLKLFKIPQALVSQLIEAIMVTFKQDLLIQVTSFHFFKNLSRKKKKLFYLEFVSAGIGGKGTNEMQYVLSRKAKATKNLLVPSFILYNFIYIQI